jgi:Tfp pilus assembly protein PilV
MKKLLKKTGKAGGFTFPEVVVASVIVGFLMTGFLSFIIVSARSYQRGIEEIMIQKNQRYVRTLLKKVVREGAKIDIIGSGKGFTVSDKTPAVISSFIIQDSTNFSVMLLGETDTTWKKLFGASVRFDYPECSFNILGGGSKMLNYNLSFLAQTKSAYDTIPVRARFNGSIKCRNSK